MPVTDFLPLPWFAHGRLLHRAREIASILARHGLGWMVVQAGLGDLVPFERGWLGHQARNAPYTQAEHLRMALGELGATFIKLGQALSTRSDFMPPAYVAELSKLQDAAPPVPFEEICQVVCAELGQPPQEAYAEFDPQPLASASIGQAHAARLKSGEPVIVKVRRPGVAQLVEDDLEILSGMAEWASHHTHIGREYNLPDLVEEFAYTLRNELDYQREAQNALRFQHNFREDPTISIPRFYQELSTKYVLTIERVEGIKVDDLAGLEAAGISRPTVAENSVRLMLREIFEFGFFHADPHPGNFFVQPDGSIALIDFGMVGSLNERLQETLLRIGLAVVQKDTGALVEALFSLGVVGKRTRQAGLERDLDHLLGHYADKSIQDLAAAQVTSEVMKIVRRHRLQLPGDLLMLLRVVAMSELLGARLDPDFRLFEFATPYLRQFLLERRSPQAIARRVERAALEAAQLGLDLPRRTTQLLSRLERGDLEFGVNHHGLDDFEHKLQRMVNRLALSILLAAVILSLALLMLVFHPSGWEHYGGWVFALAFLLALGFGAWLMWSIWRSGR
jgi:ubiquinone biosynthesis protein